MSNSSIWPIDRTLSGTTTPDQIGPGSDCNKGVLHIPQSSSIGASISNGLVSNLPVEVQLVYSTAAPD